jgi:hypothetical protein
MNVVAIYRRFLSNAADEESRGFERRSKRHVRNEIAIEIQSHFF